MYRLTAVPTMLAIALAAPLAAGEANVAPFFTSGDLTVALAGEVAEGSSAPEATISSLVDIIDYNPVTNTLVAARGIAVVASSLGSDYHGYGVWEYLDASDSQWKSLSDSAETMAVVLPLAAQIRFNPDSDYNGTASLTIRAWDGSDGSADFATNADTANSELFAATEYGGSPTAFSAETRTISMTVTAVNDRPSNISPQPLNDMWRRSTDPVVTSIIDLIGSQVDADGDAVGLAIASLEYTSAYTYEYRLDDADAWTVFTAPLSGEVLCLPRSASIQITPTSPPTTTIDRLLFTAYAWDGTGATDGDTASTSTLADAISAYSASFVQPMINSSPDWVGAPASLQDIVVVDPETTPTSSEQVGNLVSGAFYDDNGDPSGIAVIGSTGNGTWWVGTDSEGINWVALNDLTESGEAPASDDPVLVRGDQYLRYQPDPQAGDETASLTVHAWDQSTNPSDLSGELSAGDPVSTDTRTIQVGVRVNDAPVIDAVPSETTVVQGDSVSVPLTASDDDDESSLAWSVVSYSGGSAHFPDDSGPDATLQFTANVGETSGSVTFSVTDSDGAVSLETISFSILDNAPPAIAAVPATTTVIAGRPVEIDLAASDDIDTEALSWTIQGYSNGTANLIDASGTGARLSFTPSISQGAGSVTVIVADSSNSTDTVVINFTIVANETPVIVSATPGTVAVAGQLWEALVTVTDGNAGDADNLTRSGGPSETWVSLQDLGGGRYRFYGTPGSGDVGNTSSFSTTFRDPSNASDSLSISVTTVAGDTVAVTGPSPPVSTPGSIVYGAIHPGSSSNLAALSSQVVALGRTQARAFWWSPTGNGFGELPNMPGSPATAGIFLASLSAVTLTFNAPPQAAPYAITLPAQSWSFVGIPPIYTNASTVSQTHAWNDFRLESTTGVPVEDQTTVAGILGTGSMSSTRPWRWDGASYAQVDTLNTGTAYWIRNRSSTAYRLVRATNGADATFGGLAPLRVTRQAVSAQSAAASVATAAEQPPAPPSGLSAPATSADGGGGGSGGSCGAGGLAGLLIAGLALLGLRPRRRN